MRGWTRICIVGVRKCCYLLKIRYKLKNAQKRSKTGASSARVQNGLKMGDFLASMCCARLKRVTGGWYSLNSLRRVEDERFVAIMVWVTKNGR